LVDSGRRIGVGDAAQLIREKDNNLGKMLELAFRLSIGLIKKRFSKRSASLMDIEAGIYLDKYGAARQLRQSSNNSGSLLIQALMVLSNEMVSHYFMDNQLPGIFRNHLPKTKQEISEIMEKIIQNNGNKPKQEWLDQLNHSFLKAKYDVKNKGHRSLLLDSYLHFTSPIRRAADLVNHMILHAYLNSKPIPFSKKKLRKIAKHLNS
jgi:ribonuclease R